MAYRKKYKPEPEKEPGLNWQVDVQRRISDPLTEWRLNDLANFHAPDGEWWTCELQLAGLTIFELARIVNGTDAGQVLFVPDLYRDTNMEFPESRYYSVYGRRPFFRMLQRGIEGVIRHILGKRIPDRYLDFTPPRRRRPPRIRPCRNTVIVAVIDDGIAFANDLFRRADQTTRVEYAWIQDAIPPMVGSPVPQGRELAKAEIDTLLASSTHAGMLDETEFYRKAGLIDFGQPGHKTAALRLSHGTHVMGLAAGAQPGTHDDDRPIICVQLPSLVTQDVTGDTLEPSLGLALDYILDRAEEIGRRRGDPERPPVVINFSYGTFAGPHDGTGLIEAMIDNRLTAHAHPPTRAVLPAGNSNLARCHGEMSFMRRNQSQSLDWRVQPDDKTASYVQMWMPWRDPITEMVEVRVTPPNGPESPPLPAMPGFSLLLQDAAGDTIGRLFCVKEPFPTERACVTLSISPTVSDSMLSQLSPSGIWKLRVTNKSLTADEKVQVWCQRDESLPGYPVLGRQAYFDNECYERFDAIGRPRATDPPGSDCPVKRAGTYNGFACGKEPAVIGGFVGSTGKMSDYSSAGPITPTRDKLQPNRTGPDASAISDDSPVLFGVLSAGSRSGSIIAQNGTSVAAPQVARMIADELAAGQSGTRQEVAQRAAIDDPNFPPPKPELTRTGGGRLDLPFRIGPKRS